MRIGKGYRMHSLNTFLMTTLFTAWGYDLSFLEFLAFITSVVGVALGIFGPRSTWPWWNISSFLYAILFFEQKYLSQEAYGVGLVGAKREQNLHASRKNSKQIGELVFLLPGLPCIRFLPILVLRQA